MSNNEKLPGFDTFTRWLAGRSPTPSVNDERYGKLLAAARDARDEFLKAQRGVTQDMSQPAANSAHFEVLTLMAAADRSGSSRPPEVTTARGFRVTLSYEEGEGAEASSICVLVRCPPEMIDHVQGETAYLWNGKERFEIGQFDSEGKAIGTLPAGIEISPSDFAMGNVKLEEPPPPTED